MIQPFTLSKNRERKIKRFVEGYSLRLGLKPQERMSFRQHLIRICSANAKIAAHVRPQGGKVNGEQSVRLIQYMLAHQFPDFVIPYDILSPTAAPTQASGPIIKNKKIAARVRRQAKEASVKERTDFYDTWEWKRARYDALQRHGHRCMCCGAGRGDLDAQGKPARIVVDHIKPISRFWNLRLSYENLQVLCNDCNMGKGARDQTDFRPSPDVDESAPWDIPDFPDGVDPLIAEQLRFPQ